MSVSEKEREFQRNNTYYEHEECAVCKCIGSIVTEPADDERYPKKFITECHMCDTHGACCVGQDEAHKSFRRVAAARNKKRNEEYNALDSKIKTAEESKVEDKPHQALEIENASLRSQLETAHGELKQLKSLVAKFAELVRMEDPHNIEVKGLPF